MADRPVGVVRERVDGLDRHHRSFEGGHAVEGQRDDQELEDRVVAQFVPGAREGHDAVDHAAPGGREQHQREHHAERLRPVGQGGVVQVVRSRPHVDRDQRPEVDDGQAVRVDRPPGLLRHEVIHHPEEGGGQEEAHRVVAVPPLDHRIDHAGIGRVALGEGHGHRSAVDDVQHGDGDDERREEPVGDIDVFDAPLGERAEEHHGIGDPYQGDQDVDGPLELGVFLAAGPAHRQRDRREQDHQLPAPEGEGCKAVREQPDMAGPLHDVVRGGEDRAAPEGEDDGVGVQRAQAAEGEPRQVEVQGREQQLGGDDDAHQHADHPPDHGHQRELPDDLVVVGNRVHRAPGDRDEMPLSGGAMFAWAPSALNT